MPATITLQDRASLKTKSRFKTDEGFLRAPASLTRSGIIEYRATELGIQDGDPDRIVRLFRKPEHVFNDTTKASIRGIALTISHPKGVTPENWEKNNVGNVVGDPYRVGDMMMGEVLIGSKRGIDMVEKQGWEELSIGYSFDFKKSAGDNAGYEYETTGPLIVNHVAIVDKGRAGSKVRIHDDKRGQKMNEDDLKKLVADELAKIEAKKQQADEQASGIQKMVADAVLGTLKVALPEMLADMGMKKKKGDGDDEDDDKDGGNAGKPKRGPKLPWDGKKDAFISSRIDELAGDSGAADLDAAKNIAAAFLADEMSRISTMKKVSGMITDEQKVKLATASTKDILVAAVGDMVEKAEDKSEDYLLGFIDTMNANTRNRPSADNVFKMADTGPSRTQHQSGVVKKDQYGDISDEYETYAAGMCDMWMDEEDRESAK